MELQIFMLFYSRRPWTRGQSLQTGKKLILSHYSRSPSQKTVGQTSLSCKILEHVLHNSIMTHLEKHGFRKIHTCISQLIITIDNFVNCLSKHQQLDAVLLNFSKTFEKVVMKFCQLNMKTQVLETLFRTILDHS